MLFALDLCPPKDSTKGNQNTCRDEVLALTVSSYGLYSRGLVMGTITAATVNVRHLAHKILPSAPSFGAEVYVANGQIFRYANVIHERRRTIVMCVVTGALLRVTIAYTAKQVE